MRSSTGLPPEGPPDPRIRSGSHVAPSAAPHGNDAERTPSHDVPRAPAGPSDTLIAGTGGSTNPAVCHMSTPASRSTFWSMERSPTAAERTSAASWKPEVSGTAAAGYHYG